MGWAGGRRTPLAVCAIVVQRTSLAGGREQARRDPLVACCSRNDWHSLIGRLNDADVNDEALEDANGGRLCPLRNRWNE